MTDGWLGYIPLSKEDYEHVVKTIYRSERTASELLPHVHLVLFLLNDGCWVHTKGQSLGNICVVIWTRIRSD